MTNKEVGLVDKIIYEFYKDKTVNSMKKFKIEVMKHFGIRPTSDLYKRIVNYQINKYGEQLILEKRRKFERRFYEKTPVGRKNAVYRSYKNQRATKILERLENEKEQR